MLNNTIQFFRHKPGASIGFLFATGSLLLGIWVAALPDIKTRLGLTDATLGLSLLLSPVGSLLAVAISSKVYAAVPVGKALLAGHIIQCINFAAMIFAVSKPMLGAALFGLGFVGCLNGIACNAVVGIYEKQYGRNIMSTCHGMYSVGGGISAGFAALCFAVQVSSKWQIVFMIAAIIAVLFFIKLHLLAIRERIHSDSGFAAPPFPVIGLAFICFVTFIGEGCIADWSAIYLKESVGTSIAVASLGYAAFSILMALGRLNGDMWVPKVGASKMVVGGSLVAAIGFGLVVFVPQAWVVIAGFALAGIGFSCIVPVVMRAAATIPGVSPATGIAAVTTGGLTGFLLGPAAIGMIAAQYRLGAGLGVVMLLIIISAIVASRNSFLVKDTSASYLDIH